MESERDFFCLRQLSSGAQPQFSDDEEVTMEITGLRSRFILIESQEDTITSQWISLSGDRVISETVYVNKTKLFS